ncbi:MAG: hypothetical protein OXH99_13480 [Bryobacterales bacterium]|nr:hypothetical protein [Bryobacterales bacterium]
MKATLSILFLALAAVAAAAAPGPARLGGSLPTAGTGKPPLPLAPRQASRVVQVPDLHWAAFAGDLAEVRRLLGEGASVTATETLWGGEYPLHWAAIGGNPLVVRELLAAGARSKGGTRAGRPHFRKPCAATIRVFAPCKPCLSRAPTRSTSASRAGGPCTRRRPCLATGR